MLFYCAFFNLSLQQFMMYGNCLVKICGWKTIPVSFQIYVSKPIWLLTPPWIVMKHQFCCHFFGRLTLLNTLIQYEFKFNIQKIVIIVFIAVSIIFFLLRTRFYIYKFSHFLLFHWALEGLEKKLFSEIMVFCPKYLF